jgi:hypothetical protein
MKDTPPTPFQLFAARRIAEFPTLCKNADDVICNYILDSMGGTKWEGGVIVSEDRNFDPNTKTWGEYPLRMPIETALELLNIAKIPSIPWSIGGARAPISDIPNDAEKSFLDAIDTFLWKWGGLTEKEWSVAAQAYCVKYYGVTSNPNAEDKLPDYLRFMKGVPEWRAKVKAVKHFQRHGEIDPKTFMGEAI